MRPVVSGLSLAIAICLPLGAAAQHEKDPFAPEPNLLEVGAFGGAFVLSNDHDLVEDGVAMHQDTHHAQLIHRMLIVAN